MKVKRYEEIFGHMLTVRELVEGYYEDTKTGHVESYGGKLDIHPPYQRSFIYEQEKQQAVITSIMNGFPLSVMYWAKSDDGSYELMDGQQRTVSICKFYNGEQFISLPDKVSGKPRPVTFEDFDEGQRKAFLNYPLSIYICDGTESEKMDWFRIINISGIRLTDQEMRNAVYASPWVTDAKRYFSDLKGQGWASEGHNYNGHTYGDYVDADGGIHSEKESAVVRQKLMEIVISWAVDRYNRENNLSGKETKTIDDYMQMHKQDPNATALWRYYEDVMEWVRETFPKYRKIMKGVSWGILYNEYHEHTPEHADEKVNQILELDAEEDAVSNPKEVYHAVLADDMKYLNARAFSNADKLWAYKKQDGVCPYCHKHFDDPKDMQADHIVPWSKGGKTDRSNLQMLCSACNLKKSAHDVEYKPWDESDYESFDLDSWDSKDA